MMTTDVDLLPGSSFLGKYRIERVLGEGGMGIVVAATHVTLGQPVAIKFLRSAASTKAEVVGRFVREARAAAKMQGRHVAKVVDVGADERGLPYMVLEYLEGEDLAVRLARAGLLPVSEACHWVLQACEGIAEAHAAGIIHRDLKPSNLFLARQPSGESIVKVLDFGISKDLTAAPADSLTKTTAVMGTAFYMSPEQLQSAKHVDARTDVWSLGVILYELLAGRVPFDAETLPEVIALILRNRPPPLHELRPEIPPALAAIVRRAMESDPRARYRTVADFAADIAPFVGTADAIAAATRARAMVGDGGPLHETGASVVEPFHFTTPPPPPPPRGAPPALLGAGAVALLVIGAGSAVVLRGGSAAGGAASGVPSVTVTAAPASSVAPSAVSTASTSAAPSATPSAAASASSSVARPRPASGGSSSGGRTSGGLNAHDSFKN